MFTVEDNETETTAIIKFKDRNRSDLKLKIAYPPDIIGWNAIQFTLATKEGVTVRQIYNLEEIDHVDIIEREVETGGENDKHRKI